MLQFTCKENSVPHSWQPCMHAYTLVSETKPYTHMWVSIHHTWWLIQQTQNPMYPQATCRFALWLISKSIPCCLTVQCCISTVHLQQLIWSMFNQHAPSHWTVLDPYSFCKWGALTHSQDSAHISSWADWCWSLQMSTKSGMDAGDQSDSYISSRSGSCSWSACSAS